jgi:hypothetical protein
MPVVFALLMVSLLLVPFAGSGSWLFIHLAVICVSVFFLVMSAYRRNSRGRDL